MSWRFGLGLVGSFVLAGSAGAQELTSSHRAALADSLQQFAQRVERAMQRANADSILALYGRPAEFVNIEEGEAESFERMAADIREFTRNVSASPVRWVGRPVIVILSVDAAILYGTHRFEGAAGIPAHTGIWTGVLQRINGQWRIVHSHSSDMRT
jgi:hypothetical protein